MAKQVKFRRGTTAEHGAFIGAVAELTVDTDKKVVVVHDGATTGGVPLLRQDLANLPNGAVTSAMIGNGAIVNTSVASTAAIAYSKLSLNGSIVNADVSPSAAIAYSKLNLSGSITAADFSGAGLYSVTTTATSKTLVNRERCTVTAASQTIALPASPAVGSEVSVTVAGTFTNTIVGRNGSNIMSLAEDLTINTPNTTVTLVYVDATRGWRIF